MGAILLRNRTAVLWATTLGIGAGLYAAKGMPVAMFPEVEFHRISVIARTASVPVEQMITAVTQPLEQATAGVLGVETIRSLTTRGGAQLDLVFDWTTDMPRALQLTQAAVEEARSALPSDTALETRPLDTSAFPIVGVAITSRQRTLAEMSDFAIYDVAPQLRTIPGVYRVDLNGAKLREYAVTVDPVSLVQHRLDLAAVEAAVRHANVMVGGGLVHDGHQLTLVAARGEASEPEALLQVVVAEKDGTPVRLEAVARVEPSLREDFTRATANGQTAVLIGISREPGGNTTAISAAVKERLAALAHSNGDYEFSTFYDQADLVHDAIASVFHSIAIGILLAVATIFVFLADLRTTFVAAAVIPATVLINCLALRAFNMSFNLMTLGGLAAGIGLILDDAIVVVENLDRHRTQGAAGSALMGSIGEITWPLLGSTLTPVVALLPLALLGGVAGAFFRPLAVTMSVALLVSLALALSFTPALAAVREPRRALAASLGLRRRGMVWLAHWYPRGLRWVLLHRWVAVGVGVLVPVVGLAVARRLETGFIPAVDEGAFVLDYWSPPGTSLEETVRMLKTVDAILANTPEVATFARRTGAELGFFLTETNSGDYDVRLHRGPRRPIWHIIDDVRREIHARLPGLRVEFVQIIQDMIGDLSGNPSPIEIKLFGTVAAVLRRTAATVRERIAAVPGVVDAFDGVTEIGPTYQVNVDERQARLAGLDAAAVSHWLETAITGTVVGEVLENDRTIPLRLRYPESFRDRLDLLQQLVLVTPHGQITPVSALARLASGPTAVQQQRENLRQVVRVTARFDGRDLGSVMRDVRSALGAQLSLPAGVSLEYGGSYASQRQAFSELLVVFLAAVALVATLLVVEFGSIAAAIAIVLGSVLALTGSVIALWLTETALNVSSIVGMIMVVGIVAKNGILLLDRAERQEMTAPDQRAALVRAGVARLRPILMTSLAASAGLLPLMLGSGAGNHMQRPLAVAILGGMVLSMPCSLLGVPVLYSLLARSPRATETNDAPARG